MTALPPTLSGAVYDRGYRPYEGPRGGRREAALALWRVSVRRALGLRRSWRQKVFPWSLLAVTTVPAIVNVGIGYAIKDNPLEMAGFEFITYHEYVGVSTALLLFVALTAPDAVLALYYAVLGVALASLTDRRIVGGVAILGVTLVTSAVAAIVVEAAGSGGSALAVLNILALPLGVRDLIFLGHIGDDSGLSGVAGGGILAVRGYLVVLLRALAVLIHRYREVDL